MKEKKKSKYNMWQNTGFMIQNAWRVCKSVIFLCVIVAVVTAGNTIAELLISPVILAKVETKASLLDLVFTIAMFSAILFLFTGLNAYICQNTMYGRIAVRMDIIQKIADKLANTSYPNILDTEFISAESKASETCRSNSASTAAIWDTWTVILTSIIGFVVYLLLLSGLNPLLICLVILTNILVYFINMRLNEWSYCNWDEEAATSKRLHYIQQVSVQRQYAKDIRIFGLKNWLEDVWNSALKTYKAIIIRREKIYVLCNVIGLLLTLLRNGVAYAYLIWLTLEQGLSASEFLLYFSTVNGFTQWVMGILDKFIILHKQSLEISILREFLEWPEPFLFEEGEKLAKDLEKDYEIRLEQVSFRYPKAEKDTLSQINLTIHPGEKLAIVGLNGAGKTTLVKLICGFLDPTEGRVLLNGEDIRKYNRRDYYALFSAVFQDFSILEASVAENVAQQVNHIDKKRVWDCLEQAGLTEKIKSLSNGLETHIGRQVYEDGIELSGGQTQRLMLARALYKEGPILVLDEPTAALDSIAENDIYQKYNEMTAKRTSVFVSHRLASTRFCNRIIFLENGKIAEEGTHEALLSRLGGYAKLFEIQSQYYKEGGETGEK